MLNNAAGFAETAILARAYERDRLPDNATEQDVHAYIRRSMSQAYDTMKGLAALCAHAVKQQQRASNYLREVIATIEGPSQCVAAPLTYEPDVGLKALIEEFDRIQR
jgi:hypothetical protein